MDILLLLITVASLGLAACMSLVAWKLRRDARRRSEARVAVLEAIAFGEEESEEERRNERDEEDDEVEASDDRFVPAPIVRTAAEPDARPARSSSPRPAWDAALGTRLGRSITATDSESDAEPPMFTPDVTASSRGRRVLVLAAVATVMVGGVSAAYLVRGDIDWPSFATAAGATASSTREQPAPLELLSLRHTVSSPSQFTVTGLVQNPREGRSVAGLVAVVYLFDGQGRYLASGKTPIEYSSLGPGDEAPFVVTIPATSDDVSRYRVGFRLEDGAVVSHVDRRGEPPASTTGEAIDQPPSGRARRAEG
jgi:hypothetical protein